MDDKNNDIHIHVDEPITLPKEVDNEEKAQKYVKDLIEKVISSELNDELIRRE